MHFPGNVKRALAGKDVLAVLVLVLLAGGMSTSLSGPIHVAQVVATAAQDAVPVLTGAAFSGAVVAVVYLQAVVVAGLYRVLHRVYRGLQRRRARAAA